MSLNGIEVAAMAIAILACTDPVSPPECEPIGITPRVVMQYPEQLDTVLDFAIARVGYVWKTESGWLHTETLPENAYRLLGDRIVISTSAVEKLQIKTGRKVIAIVIVGRPQDKEETCR